MKKLNVLGLDVGGANLKLVIVNSDIRYQTVYYPLWKRENLYTLSDKLREICNEVKLDVVCTVMTAEICDTFRKKDYGVEFIENTVKRAFPEAKHYFINLSGELKEEAKPRMEFAAANWVASVKFLTNLSDSFIFVDIGTTTTDIIPVKGKILAAKNDYYRLRRGELVYLGMLRTPVFHVLKYSRVLHAPLIPEFYACVGDALLLTGDIKSKDYICETPDGRGISRKECMQRIARQFCCDAHELGNLVMDVAYEIRDELVRSISTALDWQAEKWQIDEVFACGKGDFIVREAARSSGLKCRLIRDEFGDVSDTFPAFACAMLAKSKLKLNRS